jgi:hypothetical protein
MINKEIKEWKSGMGEAVVKQKKAGMIKPVTVKFEIKDR